MGEEKSIFPRAISIKVFMHCIAMGVDHTWWDRENNSWSVVWECVILGGSMSDHFNPYYKWLGIPIDQQPADHYRLLGLERF